MRNRFLHMLFVAALLSGMLLPINAPAQAADVTDAQAEPTFGQTAAAAETPALEEVPADLQALFADGMTADEFVQIAGYVPNALAGMVTGEALMIIEFAAPPLAVYFAEQKANAPELATTAALQSYEQNLKSAQAAVAPLIEGLGATIIANYTAAYNGVQVLTPLARLNELAALPGVKAIHPAPIHEPNLSGSVPLIGATDVWTDFGYRGEGTVIAIIDTGIDYTHAVFGGPGIPAAYDLNDPTMLEPNTFPTNKVISGYDFAGTLYDAGCSAANQAAGTCTVVPQPDPDPLDEGGHGTHVASIAAGMAAGDVSNGVAPAAKLMALKVFGQSGSTALVLNALDWATLQYIYTGTPHVINMSLGSNFGTNDPANPSVAGTQNAASVGIVVVASAGNAGDNSYITGSPAAADKAISVAGSTSGYATGPTVNVVGATNPNQQNIIYTVASFANNTGHFVNAVTAPLGYAGALAGATDNQLCTTAGIAANALAGQIALIQRGTCAFSIKVNNAAALGAVAAIVYNNAAGALGMTGDPVAIPAGSIQQQDGINLIPANGQTVVVSAEDDVTTVPDPYTPADSVYTSTSRGPRGYDSALKPEIAAPGVGVFAARMGSGSSGISYTGTSMAAPHVAGVAALMLQGNPTWTPEQVKAVMMNTAVTPVLGATIPRVGAGRIDAQRAVDANVVAIGDDDLASLNYGVIMSRNDLVVRSKPVTLTNWGAGNRVFDAAAAFQTGSSTDGVTLSVNPTRVTVPAGGSAVVNVTVTLDMTQIPVVFGAAGLEEYYGFVSFVPVGCCTTDDTLLVPFYLQPRPYSQLDAIVADDVIVNPISDVATFDITHRGPIASSLWVYPALAQNAAPNPMMAGPGDIRLFGLDFAGTTAAYGDIVAVAIDAWNYWHVPQPLFAEFDLYIDQDQDGVWDYVNFNWNNGARTGGGNNNVWVVVQLDLTSGLLYLGSPYTIYSDYNASYMEWYLPAAWQDLGPTNSAFDYQLLGFDAGGVNETPLGSFDYVKYPFEWELSNDPDPVYRNAELMVAVHDVAGYQLSQPLGAMIVDYNGDPRNQNGAQAYLAPIEITQAFLQVAHLAPFAEDASVTVQLNGVDALSDFGYGDSTGYIELDAGEYLVEIFPAGSATAAISATVDLAPAGFYTAIAIGDGVNQDLALLALADDLTSPAAGKFHLRLGHLAPFASGDAVLADVRLQDGTPILENVDFGDVTGFIALDAGVYDLKITEPGDGAILIDPRPVSFAGGQIVSAFASGDSSNQDLGVFALPAGSVGSFLPLMEYKVYLPFVVRNYDAADWLDVTIMHTNDFHARVDEYNRNGARCAPADAAAGLCIGGAPRVATAVAEIRNNKPNPLLVDAGDQFQGTLFYNLFKGDVLNMTMNYIGYDVMTLGNHEFDSGPGVLASFIDGADFPVVSANTDVSADPDLQGKIAPYTIVERGGQEIGVIGLITPDTSNISSPGPNVTFSDPVTSLQAAANALQALGVDKIIALTHMGYDVDLTLAAQVTGVDVIVGGHSHSFLYSPTDPISFTPPAFPQFGPLLPVGAYPTVVQSPADEPVLIATAYQWGTFLGNLDVTFGPGGIVNSYDGNPIYLGADVAKDAELDELLEPYREAVADLIATEVGETTVDLLIVQGGQQICRLGECLMGNLVADAMLWRANEAEPSANYQIAFQNGGGLRAPILTGQVTMGDVMETLPFGNAIATFGLQGQYVKEALENGARLYPSANGGFAQVSGMRYVIDPAQPVGSRIVTVEVWNGTGWDPLDLDAMYKVVTNDFMRRGGDNYLMFRDHAEDPYDFGPALDEALAEYFLEFSPVTPVIEGRITFAP